ncbi:subtilase [Colletotrichum costaricense]|uniref:Subtilase n=1 Tax=Colletotrichum costaricense TaxID=1209916 RepID=A0AAJ0DTS7_9PEZI|nr:subtilase [Colletotrichum costaricense]KAK1511272.1 subtilase [Colletotrichum costaricense]
MRCLWILSALAWVAKAAAQDITDDDSPKIEAHRFIIEFASGTHAKTKRDELSSTGIRVLEAFDSPLFSGASLETNNHTLESLLILPDIVAVWPNMQAYLIAPVKRQVAVDPTATAAHAVHWATGVDELHQQGVRGQGVKVGIVDTGVWYKHTALGAGFGPGFKVAGGWDLVGDGWVVGAEKKPDADPADEQGHGTHVAGILAGEDVSSGWVGVAPDASLYSYKVFGPGDGTDQATIIDAFLRAYEDGMDVITASIGGRGGFASNAWAVVASRIAAEGVVVTIGAGNSGNGGAYYASTGSSGEHVLSVASAEVKRDEVTGGGILRPSYFTSWGGLYDLSVKPDVAAPGTDVFSTWPGGDDNEFVLLSGTSMATPYVAGVAALYISKHGGRSVHGKGFARDLSMRIISTGASLPWLLYSGDADEAYRAPSQQVGGGLVDAAKVVGYRTSLELTRFGLNDTANFRANQGALVRNGGNETVRYSFEVERWAGVEMLKAFDGRDPGETPRIKYRAEIVPSNISARVTVPEEFVLGPGEERRAEFIFEAPEGVNQTALPAYGGRLLVKSNNGETVSVPYQGLAFNLQEQMESPFHGTYPWLRSTSAYSNKTTFNFELASGIQDFPMMFMKVKWGTREVRWDIYGSDFDEARDWEYPPVSGQRGYIGAATSWASAGKTSSFNPARHNASDTFSFPETDVARNALTTGGFTTAYYWFGKLGDGSVMAPGNYTMRFAVLLPFADPQLSESWKGLTTKFTVLPKIGNSTINRRGFW